MQYYEQVPIKKGDIVQVIGSGTAYNGARCVVKFVDNLTALATVSPLKKYGSQDIHVSKLELLERPHEQLRLL